MPEPIVIGVALRDDDAAPVALGRTIARAADAPITLLHVCHFDPRTPLPHPEYERALRADALTALVQLGEPFREELDVSLHVDEDPSPARALHDTARKLGASLLVVGASHRSPLGRVVPGGVGERLLHGAPCPIAVAPRGYRGGRELHRIGVALDDTPEARHALVAATGLAERLGGTVTTYTVLEHAATSVGDLAHGFIEEARDRLPAALLGSSEILDGATAEALAQISSGLDLLVCGSRGYGPLRGVLHGSVSARLAHSCACPLLVMPR